MKKNEILNEIFWFVQPLFEAETSNESIILLFQEFGYKVSEADATIILNNIRSLTDSIKSILSTQEGDFKAEDLILLFKNIKSLSDNPTVKKYFSTNFFTEIFDYLIARYLASQLFVPYILLYALGILDEVVMSDRDIVYQKQTLNWGQFSNFISNNSAWAKQVYGWRGNPLNINEKQFDYKRLLNVVRLFIEAIGFSIPFVKKIESSDVNNYIKNFNNIEDYYEGIIPFLQNKIEQINLNEDVVFANEAGLKIIPYGDLNNITNFGFALAPYSKGSSTGVQKLSENLSINTTISGEATGGSFVTINPSGISNNIGGNINGELKFELLHSKIDKTTQLFSFGESSNLIFSKFKFIVSGNIKGEFRIATGLEKLVASIDLSSDGFLGSLVQEPIIIDAGNLLLGWDSKGGVHFEGGNNLAVKFATHLQLGPINITKVGFEFEVKNKKKFTLGITGNLNLGVLKATVEEFGISAELKESSNGLFGTHDLAFGFKPPNGLGLSIDAGSVIGGGYLFFNYEKEEYAGAMELTIAGFISAKAIGLITTKMPDGSKGFSMLIIITAEFIPAFQLGFGFTLMGVGGLLGLNRTVRIDPLRDSVRTGAVNNILFPQNVIANAPRIISDLNTIFPTYEGKFLIGPMAKIGWGTPTLISLSLGLIIEIPGNIAILGVLRVTLPEERLPLVKIQIAFVGIIDFDKKMFSFDASLFESSIIGLTLEGDMAVRLKWGDSPDFLLTVGGFHPSFTPPPLSLPSLRRLAISILNESYAKIRVECYLAVTSNTVQFGAKVELFFGLSECSINGYIGFDALFQFNPFYFIIDLSAGFSLSAFGMDVMSVSIRMSLEGPTPWVAKGTGSISLFFFDISADFNETWGDSKKVSLPDIAILPRFIEEIKKNQNWSTALSTDKNTSVTLRKFKESENIVTADDSTLIMHPSGTLVIQQKLLPLNVNIVKIGNQKTSDVKRINVFSASSEGSPLKVKEIKESYAIGQYQELSNAEKLSKPSFQKETGGIEISFDGNSVAHGKMVRKVLAYELTIIDKEPVKPIILGIFYVEFVAFFTNFLRGNSISKSSMSRNYMDKLQPVSEKLKVNQEGYSIVNQANNTLFEGKQFSSEMAATSFYQDILTKNPSMKSELQVVPNFELQES